MYDDFLFHSKSVHFLHIYPAMWRSTEKTGFVLFSVTSVFFAIPTALENIQRIKKENEKYHLRHIPTRSLTFHSTASSQNICILM